MSNRVNSITLVLEHDIEGDVIEKLVDSLYMIKGVINVKMNISDYHTFVAESRIKQELKEKLWEVLK